jgi:hypothetical protein
MRFLSASKTLNTLVKKLMLSALKKMTIHGIKRSHFSAECGQQGRAGQLGHIQRRKCFTLLRSAMPCIAVLFSAKY